MRPEGGQYEIKSERLTLGEPISDVSRKTEVMAAILHAWESLAEQLLMMPAGHLTQREFTDSAEPKVRLDRLTSKA